MDVCEICLKSIEEDVGAVVCDVCGSSVCPDCMEVVTWSGQEGKRSEGLCVQCFEVQADDALDRLEEEMDSWEGF